MTAQYKLRNLERARDANKQRADQKESEIVSRLLQCETREEISTGLGLAARTLKSYITRRSKNQQIDRARFIPSIRILYIEAKKRGLLSPNVISQLESQ